MITLNEVSFGFNSDNLPELSQINFSLKQGEIVSLVGASGCGKSTLLRLIAGVLKPTKGQVLIAGQTAVLGWSGLGFVPQEASLLPWRTVLDNVQLPLELAGGFSQFERSVKVRQTLELVNLSGVEAKYPHQLSGGMRQKVSLARALVSEAKILLLDEPFAALDELTRSKLHLELLQIHAQTGVTILLVTHSILEAVLLSHRVLIMGEKPGRIIGEVAVSLSQPRKLELMDTPEFGSTMKLVRELLAKGRES